MNKQFLIAVFFAAIFSVAPAVSSIAFAQNHGGGFKGPSVQSGGYTGPGPQIMTIMEASKQADDTWVTLRGKILNHRGDEIYTFQDASGQGQVEIDHKLWRGLSIGPNDTVELLVEIDKDWGYVELEAERITKVQ